MSSSSDKSSDPSVVTRSTKAFSAVGVVAALVIAILVNVLSARHYRRWDFTTSKLYTLSDATVQTLRTLEQPVAIEVLLSTSDPLYRSVQNSLIAYGAETTRLNVRYVDPDRHPADFLAVQQKYNIVAGRSEDQRVVTDASIVVAAGERHWFITSSDLVDMSEAAEGKSRSKIEQALTGAIRAVIGGEKIRICFSEGHGEFQLSDTSPQGLGEFKDRLEKNNYVPVAVDSTRPDVLEPFKDCNALAVIGPGQPFSAEEARHIGDRMRSGMGGVFLLNPMFQPDRKVQLSTGLDEVVRAFGIGLSSDFVFEMDDKRKLPRGYGEAFFPDLKAHGITDGLIAAAPAGLRVLLIRTRSLTLQADGARPVEILSSSPEAFGMTNFYGWIDKGGEPEKQPGDRQGPLPLGAASELAKPANSTAPYGPRLVVLGTANPAMGASWADPALRGNAVLMENIVAWVAARPPILDIPTRESSAATLRITEESLGEVLRYVMLYMPGAAALLGIAVHLRRRSVEPKSKPQKPKNARS